MAKANDKSESAEKSLSFDEAMAILESDDCHKGVVDMAEIAALKALKADLDALKDKK